MDSRKGIVAMTLSMASFIANDALIKLVGEHMATVQVVFIRGLCAAVLVSAGILLWQPASLRTVTGRAGRLVYCRAMIDALSTFGYLWALFHLPLPDITPLSPPLGLAPPIPTRLRPVHGVAKYTPPRALMIGMAKAAKWSDAVTGEGSLDVLRYGRILRARQLVGVRGVGPAFDGLHYVTSVTHTIKRGEYKQKFKLSRNGLLSTVSTVMP